MRCNRPANGRFEDAASSNAAKLRERTARRPLARSPTHGPVPAGLTAHGLGLAVFAAVLTLSGPVAAEPIFVSYTADASCPTRHAFIDGLRARISRVRQPRPFEPPWRIRASLRAESSQFVGELQIEGPGNSTTTRRVVGHDCSEVASALTLITALSIEATADAGASADKPGPSGRRAPPTPIVPADFDSDGGRSPDDAEITRDGRRWLAGLQAISMTGVGPGAMLGAAVVAGYEPTSRALDLRLRLSATWLPARTFAVSGSQAEFTWAGARVESCPLMLRAKGAALLAPCAIASLARLNARGKFMGGQDASRLWADVGLSANLELTLFQDVIINLQAAATGPLTRDKLVFDGPRVVVHDTPAVGSLFGIGLTLRFL